MAGFPTVRAATATESIGIIRSWRCGESDRGVDGIPIIADRTTSAARSGQDRGVRQNEASRLFVVCGLPL